MQLVSLYQNRKCRFTTQLWNVPPTLLTYEQDTKWMLHILTRLMRVLFGVLNRSMAFTTTPIFLPDFFLSLTVVWEKKKEVKEVLDEVRKEPWRCKRIAERWNFSRGLAGDGAWVPTDRGNGRSKAPEVGACKRGNTQLGTIRKEELRMGGGLLLAILSRPLLCCSVR